MMGMNGGRKEEGKVGQTLYYLRLALPCITYVCRVQSHSIRPVPSGRFLAVLLRGAARAMSSGVTVAHGRVKVEPTF